MKYYYNLDNLNRFTVIIPEYKISEEFKQYMDFFESENEHNYIVNIHGLVDGEIRYIGMTEEEIERDKPKEKDIKLGLIEDLKNKLVETDYKIMKCYEYSLAQKELPYDIIELHNLRQEWRNEINILENDLNSL